MDTSAPEQVAHPQVALVAAGPEILGGHDVQARALIAGLRQEGYAVGFIPINPAFPPRLRRWRGVRYLRTLLNQALYLPSLAALRHVDVVHVFSASYWSFVLAPLPALLIGRLLGKRVLLHYHSGEADDHLARWGALVHPWLQLAHEIVVPSVYLWRVFARHGYRSRVIANVVDTSSFRYRERTPLRPRLLSTRNFEPHYRVDVTLQAFALLKQRHPEATLTLAGDGSQAARLRELAATFALDGIRFLGPVDPARMPELYDQADIFVNASVIDNQPVSVLEAFAAGLPVVSTATGDIGHMVSHGVSGLLVPPADPVATATAVQTLLEQPHRALRMARRARADVERHTWRQLRQDWAAVYTEILLPPSRR